MNKFYVYQLRRADQDFPFYVGKGKDDRMFSHLSGRGDNPLKNNIINKAKSENIQVMTEKLYTNLTEEDAFRIEVWCIHLYGRRDIGEGCLANMTNGGEGSSGFRFSEASRIKMSNSAKGKTISSETRERMSKSMTGKTHTEESKLKTSIGNTGKIRSKEVRLKLSINAKNISDSHREKLRKAWETRIVSEETITKRSKTVLLRTPSGDLLTVTNLAKFARDNELNQSCLNELSTGDCEYHKGWQCPAFDKKYNR